MLFKKPRVAANVISAVQGLVLIRGFNAFDKSVNITDIPAMTNMQEPLIDKEFEFRHGSSGNEKSATQLSSPSIIFDDDGVAVLKSGALLIGNRLYKKGDIIDRTTGIIVNVVDADIKLNQTTNYSIPATALVEELSGNDSFLAKAMFGDSYKSAIDYLASAVDRNLEFGTQTFSILVTSYDIYALDESLPTINIYSIYSYFAMLDSGNPNNASYYGYTFELDTKSIKVAPYATMLIEAGMHLFELEGDTATKAVNTVMRQFKPSIDMGEIDEFLILDETAPLAFKVNDDQPE